ncbi:hypothetical protein B0H15DRAFT_931375 [Mycena belliarum]|uniref:Ser-Thr-rich glycosyl-phosphatidyl-inositol-anchored membrane family-domain-containing protein n=1 Tax=Mycena belliarum TaxID=1033014 RepID=A0AAD6U1I6_9AGAR|nr:hypothetical protein B0H15DRAFT_931375 [Mycena belliae]
MRFTSTFVSFALAVVAAAVSLDVFVPPLTGPAAGTVWVSKTQQNVTWDASGAPASISNEALLLLRKGDATAPFILAKDFDLRAGSLEIIVPWVLTGSDYSLVLFGDSGNFGPVFTIQSDTPGSVLGL